METYYAINQADRQKTRKWLLLVFGILFIAAAVMTLQVLFILPGLFMVFLAFYRKIIEVNEEGITTRYHYLFYSTKVSYTFEEYSDIIVDPTQSEPMVVFVRSGISTFAMFHREDVDKLLNLAEKANSKLKINLGGIRANKRSL